MEMTDALTITALGMGVVFSGLLLTALLIQSFSLVPQMIQKLRGTQGESNNPQITTEAQVMIPPEILAVITAVLEVERRLYYSDPGGRLTIARRREEAQG